MSKREEKMKTFLSFHENEEISVTRISPRIIEMTNRKVFDRCLSKDETEEMYQEFLDDEAL